MQTDKAKNQYTLTKEPLVQCDMYYHSYSDIVNNPNRNR